MALFNRTWAAAVLALALAIPQLSAADTAGQITVTGEGTASRVPDMATISLGVTADADSAAAALAAASTRLDGVMKRLTAEGIEARDMQSTGLSLFPRYDRPVAGSGKPQQIAGFRAASTVTVKVRALDHLGTVLDGVVKDGANGLSGLSLGLADPAPAMDEARRAAVADARHRAEVYAEAAGVKLGALVSLEDASGPRPMPRMMAAAAPMADAMAVPVAEGEVELRAEVRMVFAITP